MKQDGLEHNRWIEPVDDFVRQYGLEKPRWAVFLTYEFDPVRFNRSVLPSLSRRGRCFRAVVLADQGALEKSLERTRLEFTGAVNLHPVRCLRGGVFHPKLVFLRAGPHVRACFGSTNLTGGGLGSNLELWSFTDSQEVLAGITDFLECVVLSRVLAVDDGARRSLRQALAGLVRAKTDSVWSSIQGPFAHRIRSGTESKASEVIAISPMFSGKGGIQRARAAIPCRNLRLYTDEPAAVPNCKGLFVYSPQEVLVGADGAPDSLPTELHAKAYIFRPKSRGAALAWFGSANFTSRALAKSVAGGGNVELLVRTSLPNDEADALQADLDELFRKSKVRDGEHKREDTPPKPLATVLACELTGRPGNWKLVVQTTQRTGLVVLRHDKRRMRVRIQRGRGIIEGTMLQRLIPQLADPDIAQVLVLFQVLKNHKEVPIVVNIPHVPPDGSDGEDPQARLDWLLDDLLGRVRIVSPHSGSEEEVQQADFDRCTDFETESEDSGFERRLDLVRRQGELDQLAVKAALLKKLTRKLTVRAASCKERARTLNEYADILLAATPKHLKRAIRAYFEL